MTEPQRNPDLPASTGEQVRVSAANGTRGEHTRQTRESERVKLLWESGCDLGGGDPYNTIGTRAFRPREA